MWKYIVKRLLFLIPVILVVSFLVFSMMSVTGDPTYSMGGESMSEAEREALRHDLGLDQPLVVRYGKYMLGVIQGDLGENLYGKSVSGEYFRRLPYTLLLASAGLLVALIVAIPFGIISAVKHNTWVDSVLSALAVTGVSIPSFWLGLMLMSLFASKLGWLPTSGASDGIRSLIMPALAIGIPAGALIARQTRSSMLDNLRSDFLRTARAKGVSEKTVVMRHALKNALIPILTVVGNTFTSLICGAVAAEMVFAWPGIGQYIVTAVRSNDFNTVTGATIVTTVVVALVLLIIDIIYAFVDPRIKAQYSKK